MCTGFRFPGRRQAELLEKDMLKLFVRVDIELLAREPVYPRRQVHDPLGGFGGQSSRVTSPRARAWQASFAQEDLAAYWPLGGDLKDGKGQADGQAIGGAARDRGARSPDGDRRGGTERQIVAVQRVGRAAEERRQNRERITATLEPITAAVLIFLLIRTSRKMVHM